MNIISTPQRPVHWVGTSRENIREMPEDVQDVLGKSLLRVQMGGRPSNAVILRGFGGGSVLEIKDDYDTNTYRCVYTVRFAQAVYVLHTFMKKSASGIKTPQREINRIKAGLIAAEEHYKATYEVEEQSEEDNDLRGTRGKR